MKAIRGATTVEKDESALVKKAVRELLVEIQKKNDLQIEDIVAILFSSTADITSVYPAKAAREAGFEGVPLFSSAEPAIQGSLPLCIRVMLLCEIEKKPVPVYLNEAKKLRRDLTMKMNIALDGPAGSGKSTVAKLLAKEYDILYLDTGAMYRACALKVLKEGKDVKNADEVKPLIENIDLEVKYENGVQHTYLDGKDVSEEIRRPEVSMNASTVSAHPFVREKMVKMQQKIASETSCVIDGRDIGTAVIPGTPFKFFLTADSRVRAKRRFDELKEKGYEVDFESLHQEILARDKQDSEREFSPLTKAADAIEVDTTLLTIEEVVSFLKARIQEKV